MYDKSVKIITKTIAKRSMRFDYPSIVCMKDHAVQQRINMLISAEINRMLADTAGCEAMPESQITGYRNQNKHKHGSESVASDVLLLRRRTWHDNN